MLAVRAMPEEPICTSKSRWMVGPSIPGLFFHKQNPPFPSMGAPVLKTKTTPKGGLKVCPQKSTGQFCIRRYGNASPSILVKYQEAQSGQRVRGFFNSIDHCPEVFHRCIQLNIVSWANDEPTIFAKRLQASLNFVLHINRSAEWKGMLFIY